MDIPDMKYKLQFNYSTYVKKETTFSIQCNPEWDSQTLFWLLFYKYYIHLILICIRLMYSAPVVLQFQVSIIFMIDSGFSFKQKSVLTYI